MAFMVRPPFIRFWLWSGLYNIFEQPLADLALEVESFHTDSVASWFLNLLTESFEWFKCNTSGVTSPPAHADRYEITRVTKAKH